MIANAKLKAIESKCKNSIVICFDQVISVNDTILEKPESKEQAKEYMRLYNTYPAVCISGLVAKNTKTGVKKEQNVVTVQEFNTHNNQIPDSIIDDVIKKGDCLYCAGALVVEDSLLKPYIKVNDYQDAIMGMPTKEVLELIKQVQ